MSKGQAGRRGEDAPASATTEPSNRDSPDHRPGYGYNAINATLYDNAYRGAALIRAAVSSATTAVTRRCFARAHKLCWPSETRDAGDELWCVKDAIGTKRRIAL